MDVREQITALREQLRYHNEKYYNEDAPEITDYEYDMLQRQLRTLEAEHPEMADANSPTRWVAACQSAQRGCRFSAAEGQQDYAGKKAVHLLLQHSEQRRAADGKPCAGA